MRKHRGGNGGFNPNRRPQGGGGKYGRHQQNGRGGAPRKNYGAAREKFLNQARDAMASGDRVLAEYYLQHADHYYRMMMEQQAQQQRYQEQQQAAEPAQGAEGEADVEVSEGNSVEDINEAMSNASVLPAFITQQVPAASADQAGNVVPLTNWEDRDEA